MAGQMLDTVRLKNEFYRDGFSRVVATLSMVCAAIIFLLGISCYLLVLAKPAPIVFLAENDWRILSDIPLDQPYLKTPDLLQWVSDKIPACFTYDFVNWVSDLKAQSQYFTPAGWKKYLIQIGPYVNAQAMQNYKTFINGSAAGAAIILSQGLIDGRYGWWVQMSINAHVEQLNGRDNIPLVVQALIVRTSTTNDLNGIAIDNFIVSKGQGDQVVRANP